MNKYSAEFDYLKRRPDIRKNVYAMLKHLHRNTEFYKLENAGYSLSANFAESLLTKYNSVYVIKYIGKDVYKTNDVMELKQYIEVLKALEK